jgi:chaperonin GroES
VKDKVAVEERTAQVAVGLAVSFKPLNDFVLVKRLDENPSEIIVQSEHYKQKSDKAVVVAVGEGRILGSMVIPIDLKPGDTVGISKHSGTDIELEGAEFTLFRVGDIYGKILDANS